MFVRNRVKSDIVVDRLFLLIEYDNKFR